jgi:hypothetical protein
MPLSCRSPTNILFPATVPHYHISLALHRSLKESLKSPDPLFRNTNSVFVPDLITMGDAPPPMGAMPAPVDEEPNFSKDYSSLQMALVIANISTYAIATVFLVLRIYTSAFINRRTDIGDCTMPFSASMAHATNDVQSQSS